MLITKLHLTSLHIIIDKSYQPPNPLRSLETYVACYIDYIFHLTLFSVEFELSPAALKQDLR